MPPAIRLSPKRPTFIILLLIYERQRLLLPVLNPNFLDWLSESAARCVLRSNQLLVDELVDAELPKFPPEAGALDATERKLRRGPGAVIDKDHPGVDAARQSFPSLHVLAEDRRTKPELRPLPHPHTLALPPPLPPIAHF